MPEVKLIIGNQQTIWELVDGKEDQFGKYTIRLRGPSNEKKPHWAGKLKPKKEKGDDEKPPDNPEKVWRDDKGYLL